VVACRRRIRRARVSRNSVLSDVQHSRAFQCPERRSRSIVRMGHLRSQSVCRARPPRAACSTRCGTRAARAFLLVLLRRRRYGYIVEPTFSLSAYGSVGIPPLVRTSWWTACAMHRGRVRNRHSAAYADANGVSLQCRTSAPSRVCSGVDASRIVWFSVVRGVASVAWRGREGQSGARTGDRTCLMRPVAVRRDARHKQHRQLPQLKLRIQYSTRPPSHSCGPPLATHLSAFQLPVPSPLESADSAGMRAVGAPNFARGSAPAPPHLRSVAATGT